MLCLEWAAAAPDAASPTELRARIERLTSLGVDVALIAEAGIDAVDPRLCARPDVEGRLFLLLSDGAEAYVLGPAGPRLIERRLVSPDEDEQLTRAVEVGARRPGRRAGLPPGRAAATAGGGPSPWRGPGQTTTSRSAWRRPASPGPKGSSSWPLAWRMTPACGARASRWRDGRLEFSLTDYADSMRWLLQWIVRYRDYDAREVLVVGDDFGSDNGGGARAVLMIPELHGASFASVGAGPDGATRRVRRLGGGQAAVLELLDEQIELREARVLESFPVAEHRPRLAVPGRGLRPLPRARGRDLADRRQRRDRHSRLARRGLAGLDAGHLRGRRLRRRHRRAAHPPAGARRPTGSACGCWSKACR